MSAFERPAALWLLLPLIPLAVLEFRALALRVRGARTLWGADGSSMARSLLKAILRFSFLPLLAIAIAGPRLGTRLVREPSAGLDVCIVFDASRSMAADDGRGSRILRARAVAREAMAELPGTRFALVAFKGKAATLCPLSEGRDVLESALGSISSDTLSAPGTDIGAALGEGLRSLATDTASARALLILSDGDDLARSAAEGAERLARAGLPLMAVGFGSEEGARLPGESATGRLNKRDSAALRALAEATGGRYADEEDDRGLLAVWSALASLSKGNVTVTRTARVSELPFIFLAILSLFLSAVIPEAPARKKRGTGKGAGILPLALLILAASLGSCARLRGAAFVARAVSLQAQGDEQGATALILDAIPVLGREDAAFARYDLAATYLSMGEPALAADILERAIRDAGPGDRPAFLYELGCARYALGEYYGAWEAFRASLKERPGDEAARTNLEFAWARVEADRRSSAAESAEVSIRGLGSEAEEEFDIIRAAERGSFASAESEEGGGGLDY
jgi:Ca-activated chloride channel homolog